MRLFFTFESTQNGTLRNQCSQASRDSSWYPGRIRLGRRSWLCQSKEHPSDDGKIMKRMHLLRLKWMLLHVIWFQSSLFLEQAKPTATPSIWALNNATIGFCFPKISKIIFRLTILSLFIIDQVSFHVFFFVTSRAQRRESLNEPLQRPMCLTSEERQTCNCCRLK